MHAAPTTAPAAMPVAIGENLTRHEGLTTLDPLMAVLSRS
jgi:hypothetical protein